MEEPSYTLVWEIQLQIFSYHDGQRGHRDPVTVETVEYLRARFRPLSSAFDALATMKQMRQTPQEPFEMWHDRVQKISHRAGFKCNDCRTEFVLHQAIWGVNLDVLHLAALREDWGKEELFARPEH